MKIVLDSDDLKAAVIAWLPSQGLSAPLDAVFDIDDAGNVTVPVQRLKASVGIINPILAPLIPLPAVPGGILAIPAPPFSITGEFTWFGRNPDGSDDKGDVDGYGKDLLGAFGDDCHNEQLIGLSIPIPLFEATIVPVSGSKDKAYTDVSNRRYQFGVWCHATGRYVANVWLVDLGPNKALNRPGDMTYALATQLGLRDNAICTWACTDTHSGQVLEIKGWNFTTGKNI